MAQKLTDRNVKVLPAPKQSNRITYDEDVKGFAFGLPRPAVGPSSSIIDARPTG